MAKTGLTITKNNVAKVMASIAELTSTRVMVGIPSTNAGRRSGAINNAALGYIHENGAPEVNIPARPFLIPGVRSVQPQIEAGLKAAGTMALQGRGPAAVSAQFDRIGLAAASAVKNTLNAGVPPPLAKSTLQARARRGRKGAIMELERRAQGAAPGTDLAKPLVDTGQLRNAITYVKRKT